MRAARITACLGLLSALSAECSHLEIPDDARWDYRFALPGVQGSVLGMAFDKKRIYVGGSLESVGGTVAEGVALVDGKRINALPDGPQQDPWLLNVTDLEMFRGKLCVAGLFTNVANQAAGGFAVWHGNKWDPVEITNGFVYALEPDGMGRLLAAGRFFLPGGTNPVALARWDGKGAWENLNSDLPACEDVVCIESAYQAEALSDGNVILVLQLTWNTWPTYGLPSAMLTRCDAEQNWHNMPGPDGDPNGLGSYTLGQFQGQVVAGGEFTNKANTSLRNIALWDGAVWHPIGGGLENQVFAIAGDGRVLYAAMYFTGGDGFPHTRIVRWDGTQWTRVGNEDFSADASGRLYLGPNDELYYSGFFTGVGSTVTPNLIRWDGSRWEPLFKGNYQGVSGLVPIVLSLTEHAGRVCMGGQFLATGDIFSQGIAQWDGSRWRGIGGGIQGTRSHRVVALASSGPELFAGGIFTNMGGLSCSSIARWDGMSWSPLESGLNGTVSALTMHNGFLVAGGRFTQAGDVAANNIARWNGAQWHTLGAGCNSNVNALIAWRRDLYVGGRFLTAGGADARGIAKWDGSGWRDIGGVSGGRPPSVLTFASSPDALYIGGSFTNAGGTPARSLARWDGTNWHSVGDGWPGTVYALAVRGDSIYVGGIWTNNAGATIHVVRRLDGTNWTNLGSGIADARGNQRVTALLSTSDALWVGGRFAWAGGKPSANIARWIERPQLEMTRHHDSRLNSIQLDFQIDPGLRSRLETSTDLRNWTPLPGASGDSSHWRLDAPDTPEQRFFRAVIER